MPRPTINDVAALAGVSKKTVSRVINRSPLLGASTRAKVEAAVAELGFVPNPQARALALRHNFLVALADDGSDPAVSAAALAGALAALSDGEFALALCPVPQDRDGALISLRNFLERHRPFGVLLLPCLAEVEGAEALCRDFGARTALLDTSELDRRAAHAATASLVAQGHRRIGMIAGPDTAPSALAREAACLEALALHGLGDTPALVAHGDYGFESGAAACRLLLQVSPRPTAILAFSDEMAAGALRAATEAGLDVPGALTIASIGDTPLAQQLTPALASAPVPVARCAEAATRSLVDPSATLPGKPRPAAAS